MNEVFSADGGLNLALTWLNDALWTYLLIGVLVLCGLYFSWRTKFVQFRYVHEMIRVLGESVPRGSSSQSWPEG